MANTQEQFIGSARMDGEAERRLSFVLKENSVGTKHLQEGCITAKHLASSFIQEVTENVLDKVASSIQADLIKDYFGNSSGVTVSQKLLTDTVNSIYDQIREIKGEPSVGFYLSVTPSYFIGESGADIQIEAVSTSGIFEKVALYADDVLIAGTEATNVYKQTCTFHVTDTTVIKCVATIMGLEYTSEKTIAHLTSFWLGAGQAYKDIMDIDHLVSIGNSFRGSYEVTCQEGDHIIIVLGNTLKRDFIRADLNGFEIPFEITKAKEGEETYWTLVSENIYRAGTYSINING